MKRSLSLFNSSLRENGFCTKALSSGRLEAHAAVRNNRNEHNAEDSEEIPPSFAASSVAHPCITTSVTKQLDRAAQTFGNLNRFDAIRCGQYVVAPPIAEMHTSDCEHLFIFSE